MIFSKRGLPGEGRGPVQPFHWIPAFAGMTTLILSLTTFSFAASTTTVHGSSLTVQTSSFTWRTVPNRAFAVGEKLDFIVKWGMMTAGQATISIPDQPTVNNRPALRIVTEAKSSSFLGSLYRVRDRNESWLDAQSLSTVRYENRIREGGYRAERLVEINPSSGTFRFQKKNFDTNVYNVTEGTVPVHVLDALGSLYYLRTQPIEVGHDVVVDVIERDKVYPLVIRIKKREKVEVPAGTFDCFVVEPELRDPGIFIAKGKKMEVWITADERRMPVRMRAEVFIGHVRAELVRFETPSLK